MKKIIILFYALIMNACIFAFGNDLPPISLKNIDNNIYTKDNLIGSDYVCIILYSNHCKISQKFEYAIKEITKKFKSKNSKVVVVSPNNEDAIIPDELAYSDLSDGFEDMKIRYFSNKFNFPYLYDGKSQTVSNYLKSKTTPHAFLFNKQRKLIYNGRIGDYNDPDNLKKSDLYKSFLNALDGNEEYKKTKVHGTSIKTNKDIKLAENVKRRYSEEKVTIREIDKQTLEFFLEYGTVNPTVFYLWTPNDANCRQNLLALSEIFKIFRKRGFKLYTICVDASEKDALICLENAQLSSANFRMRGSEIIALTEYIPQNAMKISPLMVFFGKNKIFKHSHIGGLSKQKIKKHLINEFDYNISKDLHKDNY